MTIAFMAEKGVLADRLKSLRRQTRMNQEEFAQAIGVKFSTYKHYEYGAAEPSTEVMAKAAEVAEQQMPGIRGPMASDPKMPAQLRLTPSVKIPVIGVVSAGPGSDQPYDPEVIWVPQEATAGLDECYGHRVEGDSMYPWLHPGDTLVVKPQKTERIGYAFVIRTPENELRVKQLAYESGEWKFRSINRKYPDEPASGELVGIVTALYRFEDGTSTLISNNAGLKPKVD